jgi:hypothetical protein
VYIFIIINGHDMLIYNVKIIFLKKTNVKIMICKMRIITCIILIINMMRDTLILCLN